MRTAGAGSNWIAVRHMQCTAGMTATNACLDEQIKASGAITKEMASPSHATHPAVRSIAVLIRTLELQRHHFMCVLVLPKLGAVPTQEATDTALEGVGLPDVLPQVAHTRERRPAAVLAANKRRLLCQSTRQ